MSGLFTGQNITAATTLLLAIVLIVRDFRAGSSKISTDVNNAYKERNVQLDADIQELRQARLEDAKEIASIKTLLGEKDRQIQELKDLNADKNPEVIALLTEVKNLFIELKNFMSVILRKVEAGNQELSVQTDMLKTAEKFRKKP